MRILCLGAGAVGGYFAGRLLEAGGDVTFLVREARKKNLAEHGLRIESQYGNFSAPVKAITAAELGEPFDIVLLTCKAYDLPSALTAIEGAMGDRTTVLPLLNGVVHIDQLNAKFGRNRILGGVAKIASTLAPDGTIKHLNDWRFITFGEQDGTMSARVLALKAAYDKSSAVVATASPEIMRMMWEKLVHLATASGMTAAMRANIGEIARTQHGIALMTAFFERNVEIAQAEGYPPAAKFMNEFRQYIADVASTNAASMLRDIERHGPIEAQHIVGYLLDKAEAHKIDPSIHRFVYTNLQAYEQRRATNRL